MVRSQPTSIPPVVRQAARTPLSSSIIAVDSTNEIRMVQSVETYIHPTSGSANNAYSTVSSKAWCKIIRTNPRRFSPAGSGVVRRSAGLSCFHIRSRPLIDLSFGVLPTRLYSPRTSGQGTLGTCQTASLCRGTGCQFSRFAKIAVDDLRRQAGRPNTVPTLVVAYP